MFRTALLLLFCTAPLAAFQLEPITMDFDPAGPGSRRTFTLQNPGDKPEAVRLTILRRTQDSQGAEVLTAAPADFQIFPAEVILKPKSSQVVRVQYKGPASLDIEAAYRIIAEQLPVKFEDLDTPPAPAANQGNIKVLFKYQGSVYVVPANPVPQVVLVGGQPVKAGDRTLLQLTVENRGNAHVLLGNLKLTLTARLGDTQMGAVLETEDQLAGMSGENILARSTRKFLVAWPFDKAAGAVTGEMDFKPLR